jgi:Uma2 family endonuclease
MSFEEFLDWADEDDRVEWVDGEIVSMSPVSERHQDVGLFLVNLLSTYAQKKRLGKVFYESYLMKTGPDLPGREPDLLFVAEAHRDRCKENYLDGPADLVVEIVSPESATRDRREKFAEYEKGGVGEYWLIDPQRKQAEFYRLGEDGLYRRIEPDKEGRYPSSRMSGLWLRPDWLWLDPLPIAYDLLQEEELL